MTRAQRTMAIVEAIKAVYQPGMYLRQIAEALGETRAKVSGIYYRYSEQLKDCPPGGVQGRAKGEKRPRRSGLTYGRKWTQERIDTVAHLMRQGLSSAEMSAQLGVTRNAIIGVIDRTPELCAISQAKPGARPRMTKAERKERALDTSRRYRKRVAETKPKPFKPVVITNVAMLVQDFVAKNGVRKFEVGASADYYVLSTYLQERGWKLTTLQGARYGLGRLGVQGRLRSVTWKEAVAFVDKYRRAEGLQPFMAA